MVLRKPLQLNWILTIGGFFDVLKGSVLRDRPLFCMSRIGSGAILEDRNTTSRKRVIFFIIFIHSLLIYQKCCGIVILMSFSYIAREAEKW